MGNVPDYSKPVQFLVCKNVFYEISSAHRKLYPKGSQLLESSKNDKVIEIFHTSSLDSSSSTSVDTEGTLGLCHEIWSRRSLNRDPWLAAWVVFKWTDFQTEDQVQNF